MNDASFCFKKTAHYDVVLDGKLKAGIYTPWEPDPNEVSHMTIDRCTEHCCRSPDTDVVFLLDRSERVRELSHVHVICSVLVCLIEKNVVIFVRKNIVQNGIPVAVLGFTGAALAQSVERLTAGREVVDSNPGAGPIPE